LVQGDEAMAVLQAWNKRRELYAEGDKPRAEGDKLCAEGSKLCAEGNKLRAEGSKLYAEGDKLRAEGDKLCAEGNKLYAEGDKLCAEGDKLCAEGNKLRAEGDLIFYNAVIEVYGNTEIKWEHRDVIVCGVKYEWEPKAPCEGEVVEIRGVKYTLMKVPS
jgi:cobalamin biosynthesis protein CbiG